MDVDSPWNCGVAKSMNLLGGKWKVNILWTLAKHDILRFNQLKREVRGITNVMLTRSLTVLIQEQLVIKNNFQTIPPHVEYSLAEKGKQLIPIMEALNRWGKECL